LYFTDTFSNIKHFCTRINTLYKKNILNTSYKSDVFVNTAHRLGCPGSYRRVFNARVVWLAFMPPAVLTPLAALKTLTARLTLPNATVETLV
jgi:hypothetical protein